MKYDHKITHYSHVYYTQILIVLPVGLFIADSKCL